MGDSAARSVGSADISGSCLHPPACACRGPSHPALLQLLRIIIVSRLGRSSSSVDVCSVLRPGAGASTVRPSLPTLGTALSAGSKERDKAFGSLGTLLRNAATWLLRWSATAVTPKAAPLCFPKVSAQRRVLLLKNVESCPSCPAKHSYPGPAAGAPLQLPHWQCLAEQVRDEARAFFWPVQLGVAVPAGVEVAVATDRVLVKLDFENAFNTVSRTSVLAAATNHFPQLARWVHWCYRQPSHLKFGQYAVTSSGEVLFACVLQELGRELRAGPLDLAALYLDDGVIAGTPPVVGEALNHIARRSAEVAFRLPRQLRAWLLSCPGTNGGDSRVAHNFELLGAAIGDDDYVAAHTSAHSASPAQLDAIAELEDPQVGLRLLQACAGHARLVRCTPPNAQLPALQHFNALVQGCLSNLTGLHLNASQTQQLGLG